MQKVMRSGLILFLFHFVVLAASGASLDQAIQKLLNMGPRPTISDVKEALHPWPERNPFQGTPSKEAQVPMLAPEAVASMEKVFPGATWAPLGRDAALLGDILDAFYLSIGQQGRVSRLNGSGNSVRGCNAGTLVQFMESAGLDFNNIKDKPPFIIFDNTGFAASSQSTTLITAGYNAYKAHHGDPSVLVTKFNVMNLVNNVTAQTNVKAFLEEQAQSVAQIGRPAAILGITNGGQFGYSTEWHNTFGAIQLQPNGKIEGTIGAQNPVQTRQQVLFELYEVIRDVSNPAFLANVQTAAHTLGYEFPMKRIYETVLLSPEEIEKRRDEHAIDSLRKLLEALPKLQEPQTQYYSNVGQDLANWAQALVPSQATNKLLVKFIEQLSRLRDGNAITGKDYRRLLARALGKVTPDEEFAHHFLELYHQSQRLRAVLNERRGVFMQSKRPDAQAVAATYEFLGKALKCKDILISEPGKEKAEGEGEESEKS